MTTKIIKVRKKMTIHNRNEALHAKPTARSKLRIFEKKMFDLKQTTLYHFIQFLSSQKVEVMFQSNNIGGLALIAEYLTNGTTNTMHLLGDSLECDFQFWKRARRRKDDIFLQRFHCRVYVFSKEIVIVSETETDPNDILTGMVHLSEDHEHRIIRSNLIN